LQEIAAWDVDWKKPGGSLSPASIQSDWSTDAAGNLLLKSASSSKESPPQKSQSQQKQQQRQQKAAPQSIQDVPVSLAQKIQSAIVRSAVLWACESAMATDEEVRVSPFFSMSEVKKHSRCSDLKEKEQCESASFCQWNTGIPLLKSITPGICEFSNAALTELLRIIPDIAKGQKQLTKDELPIVYILVRLSKNLPDVVATQTRFKIGYKVPKRTISKPNIKPLYGEAIRAPSKSGEYLFPGFQEQVPTFSLPVLKSSMAILQNHLLRTWYLYTQRLIRRNDVLAVIYLIGTMIQEGLASKVKGDLLPIVHLYLKDVTCAQFPLVDKIHTADQILADLRAAKASAAAAAIPEEGPVGSIISSIKSYFTAPTEAVPSGKGLSYFLLIGVVYVAFFAAEVNYSTSSAVSTTIDNVLKLYKAVPPPSAYAESVPGWKFFDQWGYEPAQKKPLWTYEDHARDMVSFEEYQSALLSKYPPSLQRALGLDDSVFLGGKIANKAEACQVSKKWHKEHALFGDRVEESFYDGYLFTPEENLVYQLESMGIESKYENILKRELNTLFGNKQKAPPGSKVWTCAGSGKGTAVHPRWLPIMVTSDGYVIDSHSSLFPSDDLNQRVKVLKISATFQQLVHFMHTGRTKEEDPESKEEKGMMSELWRLWKNSKDIMRSYSILE
jgi:hypothetical protein